MGFDVALARRSSPHLGSRLLGLAHAAAATARRVKAESERRACLAALKAQDDATATAEHPRGQVMADTLVERITGRAPATGVDVQVNLLMPIDSLTGDAPAHVPDYGPIPGDLIGMDSRSRSYPGLLAHLIKLRDHTCRTPFCDAPIRHTDHIKAHAAGGATSERDGAGLCERCNYVKEHPDVVVTGDAGDFRTATGGFTATSRPPSPPGLPPPTRSHVERTLVDISWHHNTHWRAP